jgi:hypothetical protein
MAINVKPAFTLDYDAPGDVVYASIQAPQPALSVEVEPDVLLRYVPPSLAVVGCTLINFLKHFPCPARKTPLEHATAVVEELLRKYSQISPCRVHGERA